MRTLVAVLCIALGGCTPSVAAEDVTAIPVRDAAGLVTAIADPRVPPGLRQTAARLVVIAHGSPPNAATTGPACGCAPAIEEALRWFVERGYVVAYALRRGYGATGGAYAESIRAVRPSRLRRRRDRDGARHRRRWSTRWQASRASAPTTRSWSGQSAGGWGAVAL